MNTPAADISPEEIEAIAHDAWIFGLPLVEHFKVFAISHFPASPLARADGEFFHMRNLMTPKTRAVVSPNNDTLFSSVIIDLRAEPAVVSLPDMGSRYFSLQLIDIETNSFGYAGTRVSGNAATEFIIVGPSFSGPLSNEADTARVIHSPSHFVVGLARTAASGRQDVLLARELQNAMKVEPLSVYLDAPPPKPADPASWPIYFDVKFDESLRFFAIMSFMMKWHAFDSAQRELLARFAKIGVGPKERFDPDALSDERRGAIVRGAEAARRHIQERATEPGELLEGWSLPPAALGNFGDEYELRAITAWSFLYANVPEEAVYLRAYVDVSGQPLDGRSGTYSLRFPPGALPNATYFWSLTMYDAEEFFLVPNAIDRYSIGDRTTGLHHDIDGSVTIVMQHHEPHPDLAPNWLPAPAGPFYVTLRLYGPEGVPGDVPGICPYIPSIA